MSRMHKSKGNATHDDEWNLNAEVVGPILTFYVQYRRWVETMTS